MAGHMGSLLLLLVMLVRSFAFLLPTSNVIAKSSYWNFVNGTQMQKCPNIIHPLINVNVNKLLGVWYAYATTPLRSPVYRRRCASYNVENNPYFESKVLYTDYRTVVITYSCDYDPQTRLYDIKLRILTRTRTPEYKTRKRASIYLQSILFPMERLLYLKSTAYCFEWYLLKYHQRARPGNYKVPMNGYFEH